MDGASKERAGFGDCSGKDDCFRGFPVGRPRPVGDRGVDRAR